MPLTVLYRKNFGQFFDPGNKHKKRIEETALTLNTRCDLLIVHGNLLIVQVNKRITDASNTYKEEYGKLAASRTI